MTHLCFISSYKQYSKNCPRCPNHPGKHHMGKKSTLWGGTVGSRPSPIFFFSDETTLQGTNISRRKALLKMNFLFARWDMLVPWRVPWCETCFLLFCSKCFHQFVYQTLWVWCNINQEKKLPKILIENNHALESGRFTGRILYCCCLKRALQRIFETMIWQLHYIRHSYANSFSIFAYQHLPLSWKWSFLLGEWTWKSFNNHGDVTWLTWTIIHWDPVPEFPCCQPCSCQRASWISVASTRNFNDHWINMVPTSCTPIKWFECSINWEETEGRRKTLLQITKKKTH